MVKAHVRRPSTAGRGAKSPADPDADWTKTHVGGGPTSATRCIWVWTLVRKAALTPAKVYESEVAGSC